MKNILLIAGIFTLLTGNSFASNWSIPTQSIQQQYKTTNKYPKYTLGIDIGQSWINFDKDEDYSYKEIAADKYNTININFGSRFTPKIGLEAFLQKSSNESKKTAYHPDSIETNIEYLALGGDLLLYQPINKDVEILAALGLAYYDFDITGKASHFDQYNEDNDSAESLGMRTGLGLQFNINSNWAVRIMGRYTTLLNHKQDYIKNISELSLGIRYLF